MLQAFLENISANTCKSLKRVICSGEALSYNSQNQFFNNLDAELHNLYGPTEAAVDVTYWACSRDSNLGIVPIGRPVTNTQIYILDSNLQSVPIGVSGELHIGGIQVARGYLNRPELTREKFIPDPFSKETDGRLYKTGDLARFLPDGTIEYLGRLDFQVKIRGFRIELGEIEAVLTQHPEIATAVVIAQDSAAGDPRLIAYLVPQSAKVLTTEALKEYLLKKLPEYMVPAVFMTIPELPLSANGKINRKALPEPNQDRPVLEQVYFSPSNTTEQNLADIWCHILTLERIGVNDNFFDLGGNSLLIVRVASLVENKMCISIPIAKMFQYPTIRSLAKYMDSGSEVNKLQVNISERARQRRKNVARKKQSPTKL
jgi:acyl-CoA synthetase (AMP-forming)/AMP-acid ligase II/acyl carrier protein